MVDAQCINLPSYLSRRSSRNLLTPDPAVFLCISMLARAVGPNIEDEIRPILDQIFALGLSLELTNALKVLAKEIPALQKDIQGTRETGQQYYNINDSINSCIHIDGLLKMLYMVLLHQQFKHPGAPKQVTGASSGKAGSLLLPVTSIGLKLCNTSVVV